jgi:molecular chaperone DnaK
VHVGAKDLGTGKEQSIQITASSGLSKDEIDKMVKDAAAHADEDRKKRETIDARNSLDGLVYQTEKTLGENAASLDATRRRTSSRPWPTRRRPRVDDAAAIKSAQDTLARASHKLAEAMYSKATKGGDGRRAGQAGPSQEQQKPKDDVVEAEFEEVKE